MATVFQRITVGHQSKDTQLPKRLFDRSNCSIHEIDEKNKITVNMTTYTPVYHKDIFGMTTMRILKNKMAKPIIETKLLKPYKYKSSSDHQQNERTRKYI